VAQYAGEPIKMAIKAYACVLGRPAEIFLSVAVAAFGIATVVCCAHYGRECVRFLLNGRRGTLFFGIWIALYSAFAAVGATLELRGLWAVSDLTLGLMTLINLPVLCALSGEVVGMTRKSSKK
jgi:Na+/alanine symporter